MYSTCISCHAPLGSNEMIERFPVGRRLAIDAVRGRLWAICRICKQWNLSPIDERWEAIEEGERLYRDARLRTATENIGLARLRDGTELIRVGEPQRPEFAAWRYGERFARRWMLNAPVAAVGGGAALLTKGFGVGLMAQVAALPLVGLVVLKVGTDIVQMTRKAVELDLPEGARVRLTQEHVGTMRVLLDPDAPGGWQLRVRHAPLVGGGRFFSPRDPELVVHGAEALRVATRLLPRINRVGGRRRTVAEAVSLYERAGSPDAIFRFAGRLDPDSARTTKRLAPAEFEPEWWGDGSTASHLRRADAPLRLAIEMAAHEEQERAALAGELTDLAEQWKAAEEIAAIADGLVLSPSLLARLDGLRLR